MRSMQAKWAPGRCAAARDSCAALVDNRGVAAAYGAAAGQCTLGVRRRPVYQVYQVDKVFRCRRSG